MAGVAPVGSVEAALSTVQLLPQANRPLFQSQENALDVNGAALNLIEHALQPVSTQAIGLDVKA